MAGPTTTILADDLKQLTQVVTAFRVEFAEFRGRIENVIGFLKWFGAFLAVLAVGGVGTLIWDASKLDAKVTAQGERLERIDKGVEEPRARMDRIEKMMDRVAATAAAQGERMDRIEKAVDRTAASVEALTKALTEKRVTSASPTPRP